MKINTLENLLYQTSNYRIINLEAIWRQFIKQTPILESALNFSVLQNLYLATLMFSDRNDTNFLGSLIPRQRFRFLLLVYFSNVYLNPVLLLDLMGIRTRVFLLSLWLTTVENKISSKRKQDFSGKQTQCLRLQNMRPFYIFFFVLMFPGMYFLTGFSQNHYQKKKKKKLFLLVSQKWSPDLIMQ